MMGFVLLSCGGEEEVKLPEGSPPPPRGSRGQRGERRLAGGEASVEASEAEAEAEAELIN